MANSTAEERKDSVEVEVSESTSPNNKGEIRWTDWSSWRENIEIVLEMHRFHVIVITLVVLDVVIVTLQLLIDHDIIKVPHDKKHSIEHGLHTTSIAILALFVAELFLKLAVFRLEFFKKYFEVFDGVVVIVSFVLDVLPASVHTSAAELVIIARLWRVARIINGIILSITTAKEEEIKKLKKSITILGEENEKLKGENDMLHKKLEELEG